MTMTNPLQLAATSTRRSMGRSRRCFTVQCAQRPCIASPFHPSPPRRFMQVHGDDGAFTPLPPYAHPASTHTPPPPFPGIGRERCLRRRRPFERCAPFPQYVSHLPIVCSPVHSTSCSALPLCLQLGPDRRPWDEARVRVRARVSTSPSTVESVRAVVGNRLCPF